MNAQVVYLDSVNQHYLRFDSLNKKRFPTFAVREYYGDRLLSLGKTSFIPDENYMDYLRTTTMSSIRMLWTDTIITFDLYGDTLSYQLLKNHKSIFTVIYKDNRRAELSCFIPKRIDYLYFEDGSVEKYYRKKKLYKLVIVKNNQRQTYVYTQDLDQAPYYSKTDKCYYSFSVNDFNSANVNITCTAIPLGKRTYKISYNYTDHRIDNTYWSIHHRLPFFTRLKHTTFKRYYRHSDLTRKDYIFNKTYTFTEENQYDRHERLIVRKKKIHNKHTDYQSYNKYDNISVAINDNTFRYSADSFIGHFNFKRHSFVHIDSFQHGDYLDISQGVFKDKTYHFTTFRNGQLYRRGYADLYYPYQRPKMLERYDDNGLCLSVAEEAIDILHNSFRFNDADTVFVNKDTQIIRNYYGIKLNTPAGEKILFDSFYVSGNIVKDQNLCAMGIKSDQGTWLIPPTYDLITPVSIIDQVISGYYAAINDYAAIYTHKGKMLIPPTRGLSYEKVQLDNDKSALYPYSGCAFVCNNLSNDSFQLINLFNQVVLKGAGRYTIYRKNTLIKHKGRMHFPILDSANSIRWFKDTIIPAGSDYILLEEIENDSTNGQLSLLNIKTGVLHPERFRYFYNETYLTGLVSNRRKIIFTGGSNFYEDSSGLAYDAVSHANKYIILKNKNLYGLVENNTLILPPEYDGIQVGHLLILANKDSTSYLFDREGKLIKNLGQMATYYKRQDGFLELPYGDYLTEDDKGSVMIVKDQGLWGIMNNKGELLLPCIYEDINVNSRFYGNLYPNEKLIIQTLSKEKVIQAWEFKNGRAIEVRSKEPVVFFHSVTNQYYLGYYGQKAIEKRSFIERKVLPINNSIFQFILHNDNDSTIREKRYSRPYGGGNISGLMNHHLQWVVRFDTFSEVRAEQNYYYVKTKQNLCGVLGSDYRYIVPPTYPYIYYDAITGFLWHKNSSNGYWKIRALDQGIDLPDSFDYPVKFERNNTQKQVSKFGYFGMINQYGKLFIPMIYDKISESTHSQLNIIALKNKRYYVMSIYTGVMIEQPYTRLFASTNSQHHVARPNFGLNGNQLYYMDYFAVTDSSQHFFLDKNIVFPANPNVYYQYSQTDQAKNNKLYQQKKKLQHIALNTAVEFNMWWHSPAPASSFPESRTNFSYPVEIGSGDWRIFKGSKDTFRVITPPVIQDARLKVEDLVGKRLTYYCEDLNTISFRAANRYLNVCIDSIGEAYDIVLEDIIAPELKDSFSYFLRSLWLKIETPSLPCIQQNQIFDFLNNGFVFRDRKLIFLPDRLNISIARDELQAFLKPEWAERIW
jgi:hypothetical protein